ncbi:hypothetical protein FRB95_013870 [Tulasnella sp. JGI-2019a]|nr:hypothetical protein FRB95_013870 [Tulasnella sp. JGI-2019a]
MAHLHSDAAHSNPSFREVQDALVSFRQGHLQLICKQLTPPEQMFFTDPALELIRSAVISKQTPTAVHITLTQAQETRPDGQATSSSPVRLARAGTFQRPNGFDAEVVERVGKGPTGHYRSSAMKRSPLHFVVMFMVVCMLHGRCIYGRVVTPSPVGITTFTVAEVLAPVNGLIGSGHSQATLATNTEPAAQATGAPEAPGTSRPGHGESANPTTPTVTMPDITIANKTTPPNPAPVPTPAPCPTSNDASGMSAAGIAAIFGVVSSILLSCIAVWQGFCYPRRGHKKRMTRHDIELQTAETRHKSAEEELARQREAAGAALGEPLSHSGGPVCTFRFP